MFKNFRAFELGHGVKLQTLAEAFQFSLVHEGVHIGDIIALRRQLGIAKP